MSKALAARLREELVKLADSPAAFGLHCYLSRTALLSALEEVEELREVLEQIGEGIRDGQHCAEIARAALKVKP